MKVLLVLPISVILLAGGALGALTGVAPEDPTLVRAASGLVRGNAAGKNTRTFQGIPYAEAPVGPLRWQSPQPAPSWTGVRDATRPGAMCPQSAEVFADVSSNNEDCLSLNITAPSGANERHLRPVMVWIHGGSGANGAGSFFGAERLAADGDVVVVTINYRLGVFGTFGYPGLSGSGTFGLQDQQAALRWVRQNIAAFGGDPRNITLFGESFGAYAVTAHLTSPAAEGLFQRAAVQSGLALIDYPAGTLMPGVPEIPSMWMSRSEIEEMGLAVAGQQGCPENKEALECLRRLPVSKLLPQSSAFTRYAFGNEFLPISPAEALRAGRFHRLPVISGATRDEARLYVGLFFELAQHGVTAGNYPNLLAEAFGPAAKQVAARYPLSAYESPGIAWAAVITDRVWALRTLEQHKLLAAAKNPVYTYEFADRNAPPNVPFPASFPPGAFHNAEIVYQFRLGDIEAKLNPDQWKLANQMNRYWANFAHRGDPNGPDLPAWKRFDPATSQVLALAPGAGGIAMIDYSMEHQSDFWLKLGR